ncbi:TRAP transporter large permease subunit [Chloroflexota bacterium]
MDVSPVMATVILFGVTFSLLALGLPIAFALGGSGILVAIILWGPKSIMVAYTSILGYGFEFILVAIPLFIFMGVALERSGIAEALYTAIYMWSGGLRGGLAAGTVMISTIMAAMTGISGTACVTMGLIALPSMLKNKYDKNMAIGCIMGGAALGQLIPPSVIMIMLGLFANISVGKLFAGGVFPGLLLSGLFILYILIRSKLQPNIAPALAKEDRATWREKLTSLKHVILPVAIIVFVLGSIFSGIATPTEAAGVGAIGTLLCTLLSGKFTLQFVKEAASKSMLITTMCIWLIFGAATLTSIYSGIGGPELVKALVAGSEANRWVVIVLMQVSLFVLGCFLDPAGILMLTIPVYMPIVISLGFDPLWFGIVFTVNMEMAYLTPPFGFNLFYMKGIVPENIKMADIYRSSIPFVALQLLALIIIIIFPSISLWFPGVIFR